MKRILPLLALLALPAAGALPHPASYEFDYGAKFTVSGYAAGKPALSGFPVLVRIQNGSPSGFSYDDLQSKSTGADIAFVDMDGNGLPFEIDTWDPSGESLIWVKLPTMQNGTEFVMCWGSDTAGKTVCGDNPFAGYYGVWHMNEANAKDSSANHLDGTANGSVTAVDAKLGKGASFSSSAKIETTDTLNSAFSSAISFETWAFSSDVSGKQALFGKEALATFKFEGSATLFTTPGKKDFNGVNQPVSANTWYHIVLTFVPSQSAKVYVDGVLAKTQADDKNGFNDLTKSCPVVFGSNQWNQYYKGVLDECRLLTTELSADWIAADYATQSDASFLTVGAAEVWREKPEPAAELSVGSVQISNAVATVSVSRLGADANYVDVTVQVSADSGFSPTAWTTTYHVTGEDTRNLAVTGLEPFTTYYARAVAANDKGKSVTTDAVSFKTRKAPRPQGDKIVEGLEDYGALTLVDEIDCSLSLDEDPDHMFREYPSGWSTVEDILDVPTRVMHHKSDTCCYVSWRVGKGKGIVPNEPYVLVVDYPDEAPRSVTVFNFGNATRHGYHTGWTAGDSWSPPYVTQSIESWAIPYSGETKQLVQVMVPFEKSKQYNGSDSRIYMDTEGFDLNFGIIKAGEAPDSVGLAVSAIRLYKIDSYDVARPRIPYPVEGLPRRIVTSREEMGDGDDFAGFKHPQDFYKGRAKMIRLLGMNTCSKDLLEFGYMQNFRSTKRWGEAANYWDEIVDNLAAEDVDIFPFYEYHGSRGSAGWGYVESNKPWTLNSAKNEDWKYLFSNQSYVYNCMMDMTSDEAIWDLENLYDTTIKPYLGKANFRGMWIRNRGAMPIGFSQSAIDRFNSATGSNVTRGQIYNNGNYGNTELYKAYRTWWYGKRCNVFRTLQSYIKNDLGDDAKVFYSNTIEEPGEFWANWGNPRPALISNEEGYTYQGKNFNEYTGKNWSTDVGAAARKYWSNALNADCPTWGNYEVHHSAPADDPHNYTNLNHVTLCYPFNTVWTVADKTASARYRNASGDLPFVRHYSLNENDFYNESGSRICGYYTCDWDHAGRAVVLSELYAMAYDDPTMLAYLFTANLVRNDSTYVREFNLNYLSLPALPGEVLVGGEWPATFTVRRWVTDKGTYWAVINCDSKPWSGQVDFQTEADRIWYTVSGDALPLSDGKANLELEPFQMVCFTGVEPEHVLAPTIRYGYASGVEARAATLNVNLADLGYGATSATVTWSLSGGAAAVPSGEFPAFSTHGAQSVAVSGLEADTLYTVMLVATNSKGESAETSFTFRTAIWPFAFETPVAATDANGTTATASIRLTRADASGSLYLVVDGATNLVESAPVPGTKYSGSFPVKFGATKRYRFYVVDSSGQYPTWSEQGRVKGRKTIGWIDIELDKSDYAQWPFPTSGHDPTDGGTWTKDGGSANISQYATDGGNKRIDLATEETGSVVYQAEHASETGKKVRIQGRTQLAPEFGEPDSISPAPLAALALGKEGTVQTLYGYAASGWVPFADYRVPSDGWIDWTADIDFDAGTVTYSAGDPPVALADGTGATALGLANASKKQVSRVTYVGSGAIDDFHGFYYFETNLDQHVETFDAAIRTDATGLSFTTTGPDPEDFVIGLENATDGEWYAAFGSTDLNTDKKEWRCVSCEQAHGNTVDLPANSSGKTAQFFVIYGVTEEIDLGTRLSDVLPDED